jgi:uncharacterized membrane protein YccC
MAARNRQSIWPWRRKPEPQHEQILHRLTLMAQTQAELAAELREFKTVVRSAIDQVNKATGEVSDKIRRLEELIAAGGPITQELKDLAAELRQDGDTLKSATQRADDVVPDAPPANP